MHKNLLGLMRSKHWLYAICLFTVFNSCVDQRKAVYFNNVNDTTFVPSQAVDKSLIQKNDLLSINVSSLNPEATIVFNSPNLPSVPATTAGGSTTTLTGYLVGDKGTIQFPVLGAIVVEGLTKTQTEEKIVKLLEDQKQLVNPIVNVRFLNFRVTVMGEVARPTVINVANEKISILEALGLAGDLTVFARRDNVLLIRDENGVKKTKRLNLNSNEIFSSPYYYLKTNDIVYAEPNKSKISSTSSSRTFIPILFSGLSFITIIIDRVLR